MYYFLNTERIEVRKVLKARLDFEKKDHFP